jgi:histidinol-phosphate/aromatic aminotransferase/cobyric acid decarboxylase-like protein
MQKERAWFSAHLSLIPCLRVFSSSANFLLLQITEKDVSAAFLAERLAREKILIRVCDNFVGLGKQFFRVAVRTRIENRHLLRVLRTIICSHVALKR